MKSLVIKEDERWSLEQIERRAENAASWSECIEVTKDLVPALCKRIRDLEAVAEAAREYVSAIKLELYSSPPMNEALFKDLESALNREC